MGGVSFRTNDRTIHEQGVERREPIRKVYRDGLIDRNKPRGEHDYSRNIFFFDPRPDVFNEGKKKKREKKIRDSVTTVAAVIGKFDREGKQGGGGNSWRENLVCRPELAITRINFAPA